MRGEGSRQARALATGIPIDRLTHARPRLTCERVGPRGRRPAAGGRVIAEDAAEGCCVSAGDAGSLVIAVDACSCFSRWTLQRVIAVDAGRGAVAFRGGPRELVHASRVTRQLRAVALSRVDACNGVQCVIAVGAVSCVQLVLLSARAAACSRVNGWTRAAGTLIMMFREVTTAGGHCVHSQTPALPGFARLRQLSLL